MHMYGRTTTMPNPSEHVVAASSAATPRRSDVVTSATRLTLEQFPHGLVILGEQGTVLRANRQAEIIFAYAPGELAGLPISQLLPEQSRIAHAELWTELLNTPQSRKISADRIVGGVRKDGVILPLEMSLSVVVDGNSRCLVASIVDITERLNLEARLAAATNERLGFQRLVGDIAARFGSIDADTVDESIVDSLRQIGDALQLDLAILWRKSFGERVVIPTHYWVRQRNLSPPEPLPVASIPFVMSKLEAHAAYWFSRVDEVPDAVDRETFQRLGLRSAAIIPLASSEDGVLTALAFGSMAREQEWAPAIIDRLRLVAGVVSQAFARRATFIALQKALDEIRQLRDRLPSRTWSCAAR